MGIDLNNTAKSVKVWNERAGLDYTSLGESFSSKEWWTKVVAQARVNAEEALEGYDASQENDLEGVLDGIVDNLVTLSGLLAIAEESGFDLNGAITAVLNNNDLKLFKSYHEAVAALAELQENGENEDFYIDQSYVDGVDWYSIKDGNGKIRKFKNFPKVDLKEFLPTI